MNQDLNNFLSDEDGAVTVDWVVLTAAIVGLGIGVIASISTGTDSVATKLGGALTNTTVSLSSGLVAN